MTERNNLSLSSIVITLGTSLAGSQQCLEKLYAHTRQESFELLLVDTQPRDSDPHHLQDFTAKHQNCRLIRSKEQSSFSAAKNQGAALAQGEYLIFLDDDTIVGPHFLPNLLRHLDDADLGMIAPVTNESSDKTRIATSYQGIEEMESFALQYEQEHAGQTFEIDTLDFSCVAMRRSVFEETGPLDERFRLGIFYGEDYARRLQQLGYHIGCAEDVFVHHLSGKALSASIFSDYWETFEEDRRKFEQKWGTEWGPPSYREALFGLQRAQMMKAQSELAFQVIERDQRIWELEKQVADLSAELFDTKNKLFGLYASTAWKIMQVLWRVRLWLAPHNSARERAGRSVMEGVAKLFATFRSMGDAIRTFFRNIKISKDLDRILAENPSPREIVIFLPTMEWNATLFQRPHQLAMAFAKQGCLVFFCTQPGSHAYPPGFHLIEERLYIAQDALKVLERVQSPVLFGLVYNHRYVENFIHPYFVYEYIDELDVFPGDLNKLKATHAALVQSADLVLASADKLYQDVETDSRRVILSPNGVDADFIRQTMQAVSAPPDAIAEIVRAQRPIIGYYGALAEWMDYSLLKRVARIRPHYRFLLIGPDYDGSIKQSRALELPNILWLGPKPYAQIPAYLKYFNVATIPFLLNDLTHAVSPLKLFEYMAGGKPIVTTAMHECKKYPPVLIAEDAADFAEKIDAALALQNDPAYQRSLAEWAEKNTWMVRASQILDALKTRHGDLPG
ncbi:MAG TPA: glycosyltransferase [Anaerolineales bacterium]|nr:glycosyltransferase [Anaerolineales bacterium]